MQLQGSCRCGAVSFTCTSHTPVPFMRCYCSICRKVSGGGGFCVNIMAQADGMEVQGRDKIRPYRVMLPGESGGSLQPSTNTRMFCCECGSHLWCQDPGWPQWVYPFAGAIDSELPVPPHLVHMMLSSKAPWVQPQVGVDDQQYEEYPELSIEEWHKKNNLYVE